MDPATLSLLVSAVSGPASGVVVAMLCLVGFGYFMVKYMLPQQQTMINDFVKESRASRKVFVDAVEIMSRRLDKVEDGLDSVEEWCKRNQSNLKRKELTCHCIKI
jgi:cobalamin biosynthesis protein CobD/CbiB